MFDVLKKITLLREKRGWTTYRLAKLSNIPQSTIATWYRKNLLPPIDKLDAICHAFGISLSEFFNPSDGTSCLTAEQQEMLSKWNLLTPNQRKSVLQIIDLLLPENNN